MEFCIFKFVFFIIKIKKGFLIKFLKYVNMDLILNDKKDNSNNYCNLVIIWNDILRILCNIRI